MTAEEFLRDRYNNDFTSYQDNIEALKEFAKYHVEQALQKAYDYHTIEKHIEEEKYDYPNVDNFRANKQSVIGAYPPENIK